MSLKYAISSRLKQLPSSMARARRQSRDPNFIGFDKYRKLGAYHWDEMSHGGDYAEKVELIGRHCNPHQDVLDLGCGDGAYVFQLSRKVRTIVGIDADYDAVRLANRQLRRQDVANATCLQLPLSAIDRQSLGQPNGFDVVYSMDVIEHLPRPEELLETAKSVVHPDGTIIIGTPMFINEALVSKYHVKEFTRDEISALLRNHFEVVEEVMMPMVRLDGVTHEDGFYVAVGRL